MQEITFLVEEAPEGWYTARALGYSIYTESDTWDELKMAVRDAILCHFETEDRPHAVRLHFSRQEVFAV